MVGSQNGQMQVLLVKRKHFFSLGEERRRSTVFNF
jgi:hypothetical protein